MKRKPVTNITRGQLVFPAIRDFNFESGETKRATPAQLSHPTVKPYIGRQLVLGTDEETTPKAEPEAPVSPPSLPAETAKPEPEPIASEPVEVLDQEPEVGAGETLRDQYLAAPGITESNVDDILAMYPSLDRLAGASKDDFISLGVAKSYAKKLVEWADQ
jgi:hypothetical protein